MAISNQVPGISYRFKDASLLKVALTHRSLGSTNNERLEFLGDSILNFVVAARLFELKPEASEGDLSRLRSRVVRGETLAKLAAGLRLGDHLLLGEGELKSGGYRRRSILGDALEAVLGAIYIDGGFDACALVIRDICDPFIAELPDAELLKDPKTRLQEWMQARSRPLPDYRLIAEEGAEHAKKFTVQVCLADTEEGAEATGDSRRRAEQAAASGMLELLAESAK
jgi:ribonuclease-3